MRTSQRIKRVKINSIFTFGGGTALCCLAVKTGHNFGVNSSTYRPCAYEKIMRGHQVLFVDNDYRNYNHDKHIEVVAKLKPKYATTLDIMSPDELPRILDYAHALAQHAENVILIPKCDCVDQIPPQFMLGYAVPTSHGGTELPYSAFDGFRVHLLGGAWGQQRDLLLNSGMNIVSIDFNHCNKIAQAGYYTDMLGRQFSLRDTLPHFGGSPLYTAMALSFANISAGVHYCEQRLSIR